MIKLRAGTIQQWFSDFVAALQNTSIDKIAAEPLIGETPSLWPLRSVNSGVRYH